jgi:hypothetical protein
VDTEEEARQIASMHDAFGRDWRDPRFAVCDALETSETHVLATSFRSERLRSRKEAGGEPEMTWNARGSGSFSAHADLSFPIA